MSNSIWKKPDQKPDVFKPHRILVIYEAHDEPELMFSAEYAALTADRYVNRWCYLDELIATADRVERMQGVVGTALISIGTAAILDGEDAKKYADAKIDLIKQLIKEQ